MSYSCRTENGSAFWGYCSMPDSCRTATHPEKHLHSGSSPIRRAVRRRVESVESVSLLPTQKLTGDFSANPSQHLFRVGLAHNCRPYGTGTVADASTSERQ